MRPAARRPLREIFLVFLRLGLTSFGGPIAHLGYFRETFVTRRGWLADDTFGQLLAIAQFLPGPASSQLGFAIGLVAGGWAGALAAFVAFTAPSALLMGFFAAGVASLTAPMAVAAIAGLELVALAVVAHALIGMAPKLCPDGPRRLLAGAALIGVLIVPGYAGQLLVVALGAAVGYGLLRDGGSNRSAGLTVAHGPVTAVALLVVFVALLVLLPLAPGDAAQAITGFYRSGALVFGGGHVVLPLLDEAFAGTGWLTEHTFLAGYGAAQAIPGPMFTLATYLGVAMPAPGGWAGGLLATAAIFLPGFLLLAAVLPLWQRLPVRAGGAVAGINAAVVGILAAALYDPIWTSAVRTPLDVLIAAAGLAILRFGGSALLVVAWCIAAAIAASSL